jgi:GST-like protein
VIDVYYWPTPNGHKVTIYLEETALPYTLHPIDISRGEQFNPDFLRISPNNRMPAIIDREPADGGPAVSVFESGAILLYLAHKTGNLWPKSPASLAEMLQWLMWQMSGLGPMAGQNHHFRLYAPERLEYAINRYVTETARLYGVLDRRLADRPFIAGDDFGLADIASYPWIVLHEMQGQRLEDFPHMARWYAQIAARPAVIRAYARGTPFQASSVLSEEAKKLLFNQTAETTRART